MYNYPLNIVQQYNLEPADRIVVPKSGLQIVQHHAIYWGMDNNFNHWVMENVIGVGVKYTELGEFLSNTAKITRVEKFNGNWWARQQAINRGQRHIGQPYNALTFNCEHFANIVQRDKDKSGQVSTVLGVAALAALVFFGARNRK